VVFVNFVIFVAAAVGPSQRDSGSTFERRLRTIDTLRIGAAV
jgi:hypothetical protein